MKAWTRTDDGTNITKSGFRTTVHKEFLMNSGRVMQADIIGKENSAAAGIIGITKDKKVVIARQFRCGPEKVLDEIPGGFVDPGESPEHAALREFKEEVGYEADVLEYLGFAQNAWDNTVHHYYLARDCRPIKSSNPEDDEEIEVDTISIKQFIDNAKQGLMTDAQAVLLAYDKLKEIEGEQ